jgi:hypothetical protein
MVDVCVFHLFFSAAPGGGARNFQRLVLQRAFHLRKDGNISSPCKRWPCLE